MTTLIVATASGTAEVLRTMFELPNIVFVLAGTIAVVAILTSAIQSVAKTRERENTKREIAAYLSQGLLTDEQASLLLRHGKSPKNGGSGMPC